MSSIISIVDAEILGYGVWGWGNELGVALKISEPKISYHFRLVFRQDGHYSSDQSYALWIIIKAVIK